MSEPVEPRENIDSENWKEFLQAFSERNNGRRARFDLYAAGGRTEEEDEEAHFEEARLEVVDGRRNVVVVRIDRGKATADKIRDEITNVRGVAVQYDTDGSEDVLEIIDDENSLISLRFESRVDGVS